MDYKTFHGIDPALAEQFLEAQKFREQVSEWQQSLRDQIYLRLEQLGKGGLGEPVYQDEVMTMYPSLLHQAGDFDDPILNPLVAEHNDQHDTYKRNDVWLDKIYDEILKRHGLIIGVEVTCDSPNIEDQYVFEADQ